ncbi:MAG: NIPSNAP family protein [Candidatus Thiodiazotropha sp. (ex Lucinoma borealis)]|nr:NIPSNAP family protein [Candidatus Thiodiazotropha sp. (ex Lucinoma borealis)]
MAIQMRIYTINRGYLKDWVSEWQENIKPLRLRLGFEILGAWTNEENNQFYWILKYEGKENWDKLDAAFHESEERRKMQPNPARHIAKTEQFFLNSVL